MAGLRDDAEVDIRQAAIDSLAIAADPNQTVQPQPRQWR
jgi:hypothetical protein